jgi:squalene-hopene/tetraprenyl-beta-curcumene cyclase
MTSTIGALRSVARTGIVLTCLSAVPNAVASQVATPPSAWSPSAAAEYLDQRMAWWATWPVAARDQETACVACHTGLPYALARPALRPQLGEVGPSPTETKLIGDVARRVTSWNDIDPY